jgi:hypothetical protein
MPKIVYKKVDSYEVEQYKDTRFVDTVQVLDTFGRKSLCYSPKYRANVLILISDLQDV